MLFSGISCGLRLLRRCPRRNLSPPGRGGKYDVFQGKFCFGTPPNDFQAVSNCARPITVHSFMADDVCDAVWSQTKN